MTGPEHYRAAEKDIDAVPGVDNADLPMLLARTQVHATLALAAATALCTGRSMLDKEFHAWDMTAGTVDS